MKIEVLICTIGSGIANVPNVLSSPRADVSYLVSFQYSSPADLNLIPDILKERKDVRVLDFANSGLSVNRNQALRHSNGDIILFADDDNRYTDKDFDRILYAFNERPDLDIICFKSEDYDGKLDRDFPKSSFSLETPPRGYFVRSCEIAVRRKADIPSFDINFGLGSPYLAAGEEEIFVFDAVRKGLRVWYFPMTIVRSARETTGKKFASFAAVRRSKGAVLTVRHGIPGAFLRVLKYSLLNVHGMSRIRAFRDMLDGIRYASRLDRYSK